MLEINDYVSHLTFNIEGVWIFTKDDKVRIGVYLGEVPHEINIIKYPLEEVVTNLACILNRKNKNRIANEPIIETQLTFTRSKVSIGSYFPIKNNYKDKGSGITRSILLEGKDHDRWGCELVLFKDNAHALTILDILKDKR